jgi:hypothetical protein
LGCSYFDPNDARREVWNGKWPGEEDCERLGFDRTALAEMSRLLLA